MKFNKTAVLQTIVWIVFYLIWVQVVGLYMQDTNLGFRVATYQVVAVAAAFYAVYFLVNVKKFYGENKGQLFLMIGQIVFILGTLLAVVSWFTSKPNLPPKDLKVLWEWQDLIFNKYFLVLAGALAGLGMKLFIDWKNIKINYDQLEKEKLQTELAYLKSQINPHFIFNSLNTIHFQIDKENKTARNTLLNFSDLLRYQLYECNEDKIAIEKEIEFLKNFVALQKIRKDENYLIEFVCNESVKGFFLSPLLLIPLIENAFKHVSNYANEMNEIKITMEKLNSEFLFSVFNTKENEQSKELMKEGGIGLANVKRRLELLYNGNHELTIDNTEKTFTVNLKIKLP